MTITMHVPTILRSLTKNNKTIATSGYSVLDAIEQVEQQYPGIKERLIFENEVHRFMNIYVNDNDIRFSDNLATPLKDGDIITILPAVAGG